MGCMSKNSTANIVTAIGKWLCDGEVGESRDKNVQYVGSNPNGR
jgi:hypothetical protein